MPWRRAVVVCVCVGASHKDAAPRTMLCAQRGSWWCGRVGADGRVIGGRAGSAEEWGARLLEQSGCSRLLHDVQRYPVSRLPLLLGAGAINDPRCGGCQKLASCLPLPCASCLVRLVAVHSAPSAPYLWPNVMMACLAHSLARPCNRRSSEAEPSAPVVAAASVLLYSSAVCFSTAFQRQRQHCYYYCCITPSLVSMMPRRRARFTLLAVAVAWASAEASGATMNVSSPGPGLGTASSALCCPYFPALAMFGDQSARSPAAASQLLALPCLCTCTYLALCCLLRC
ncbi:hypothetical protein COCVIDRAFT_19619 [Bipolaris victoriae FI3]|uniref:Uncharacterized protein n=1 Tax=Bipolaris victoriae (strain FI3) TaxID=930091 RepID=W7DXD9_BIPV3|nr:hypothetical protein COCVIDRAFT_19619 [Bipolaris victoriae FI3]